MMEQNQFEILKTELLLTQQEIDKYDQMSTTIKTWSVTLWVASSGWALQSGKEEILLLSAFIMLIFWFFDGINKTFRMNYKRRRDEVSGILGNIFRGAALKENEVAPQLPIHDLKDTFRYMVSLHLILPYLVLAIVSVTIFLVG